MAAIMHSLREQEAPYLPVILGQAGAVLHVLHQDELAADTRQEVAGKESIEMDSV
jgi:hypothetical protein